MGQEKPPIADVLTYYGADVNESGGQRKIRCPFHGDDRNASASVHWDKAVFNCFTCGVRGDSLALIMSREGLTFVEALSFAERVFGGSYRAVRGGNARKSRRRVFEDEGPSSGQSDLFSARPRRRPFAGT